MEKISFFDVLAESWSDSLARIHFFVFGFFVALPTAIQFLFPPFFLTDLDTIIDIFSNNEGQVYLLISIGLLSTLFGKGALIRELFIRTKDNSLHKPIRISLRSALGRLVLLELAFGFFLAALLFVLSLPSFLSWFLYQEFSRINLVLGMLIFIPVIILAFFIRQFSYYYFLFSPLTLRSAIDRATTLFFRHRSLTLFFGVFCMILSSVFTFSLNIAMLGGTVLLQPLFIGLSEVHLSFLISLFFLSWYMVLNQSLWLRFFLRLANPKKTEPEANPITVSDKISESPTA